MSIITLPDGRHLSYSYTNSTNSPHTILLSNSLCAPYHTWDKLVTLLTTSNYAILRYDQPGHGSSSAPEGTTSTTFTTLAEDVKHLLDSLQIPRLHAWIGVSMGAATGIYFASMYPGVIQNLIVCDTITRSPAVAGVQDVFGPRVDAAWRDASMDAVIEQTIQRWFTQEWRDGNKDEVERVRGVMRGTSVEGFAACCNALRDGGFDLVPLVKGLGGCVEDVAFVVGELDANLPRTMEELRREAEDSFARVGKKKEIGLHVVKQAGHVCYIDNLQGFHNAIASFLSYNQELLRSKI